MDYILKFDDDKVKSDLKNKYKKKVINPEYVGPRILNDKGKIELLFPIKDDDEKDTGYYDKDNKIVEPKKLKEILQQLYDLCTVTDEEDDADKTHALNTAIPKNKRLGEFYHEVFDVYFLGRNFLNTADWHHDKLTVYMTRNSKGGKSKTRRVKKSKKSRKSKRKSKRRTRKH
jgi:hypothetical protein